MEKRTGTKAMLAVAAAIACAAASAKEVRLWPSAETDMLPLKDSVMSPSVNGGPVSVKTGSEWSWPGVKMTFKGKERDLSMYSGLKVAVSNMTERPLRVRLSVKGHTHQGKSPGGYARLGPKQAGTIVVGMRNMPWAFDKPLKLDGMNGCPGVEGSMFDLRRTLSFHIYLNRDGQTAEFAVTSVDAVEGAPTDRIVLKADEFMPFVDKFGQFKHGDWPGKYKSEEDFAKSIEREDKWLADNAAGPVKGIGKFGGWAEGPKLKATGRFRTEKVNGKWWLVDPEGYLFFSHGVDCVHPGSGGTGVSGRENYFEWLPEKSDPLFGSVLFTAKRPGAHGYYSDPKRVPYLGVDLARANLIRKYGKDYVAKSAERTHRRLKAWGLNTIGNWSSPAIFSMAKTPYTTCIKSSGPVIEGSTGWWGKLVDPYDPEFSRRTRKLAEKEAAKTGRDPWCIGWFVDNELSFGSTDKALAESVIKSPATQAAKKAFAGILEKKYGSVGALNKAWGFSYANWDEFLKSNEVPATEAGVADLRMLHRDLMGTYFRNVRDAVKAAAPDILYLGSRIAWGAPVVYEECARYCDVVSVNVYSRQPVADLPSGAIDKPMINGEFHFGALDRGMFHTGLVGVRDQEERAQCYKDYVNGCLDNPRLVGTHWFQWQDQALTGRSDGENYQIGFVTCTDEPYPELVEAAREVAAGMYARRYGKK